MLLAQGEFTRGWREYRFRYQLEHTAMLGRHVLSPRWDWHLPPLYNPESR